MNGIQRYFARALAIEGLAISAIFIVMITFFAVYSPFFLSANSIHNTFVESVPAVLLAAGMAFVIISGGFDLSVGSNLGLSAAVALFTSMSGAPMIIALLAGVGTGLLFGIINGTLIAFLKLSDFIVTLASLSVGAGLLTVFTGSVQLTGTDDNAFLVLTDGAFIGVPGGVVATVVVLILMELMLIRTPFGRSIYATGINPGAAYLAGVNVRKTTFSVFVVSGAVAGLAGVLLASHLNSVQPGMGAGYELSAIAACVVGGVALGGGRGSIWRAVVGAMFLSVLSRGMQLIGVDTLWFSIVTGVAIVAAVAFDSGTQKWLQRTQRPGRSAAPLTPARN